MKWYDLVFSDRRGYRLKRHGLFWGLWCLYFLATFLIPTYWVPGWNLKGPMPQIEKYGVLVSCLRLLMNGVLMTVVHMALTYGILYFILPRYFRKEKSRVGTTLLLLAFVVAIACFNYLNFLLTFAISTHMGYFAQMPDAAFIVPIWGRQILFNYPTVVGFAVAIKLLKNWYLKQQETVQLTREKIHAELQLLKAQVHPHFLFNTLNNIYSFILKESPGAPGLIQKLSDLLRFIVYRCNQPLVPLEEELKMIRDYMDLEQVRYGEHFNMMVEVKGDAKDKMISPLLLLPFLENSFKHGTSRMLSHPWVKLHLVIEETTLYFTLANSKPATIDHKVLPNGLGLNNVKKRLELLYPGAYTLRITEDELSFDVQLILPLFTTTGLAQGKTIVTESPAYELV